MPHIKILGFVLQMLFRFLFNSSKDAAKSVREDLVQLFLSISRIGTKRAREFLFAVPSMLEFALHLVRNAGRFPERSRLVALGAAAALASIVGALLISVLGSWSVQLLLLFSFPIVGLPLLISSTLALLTAAVLYIWLVIVVLDQVMVEDPYYKHIRDQHLSPEAREALDEIAQTSRKPRTALSEHSDGTSESLIESLTDQMAERGGSVKAADLEQRLQELRAKLTKGGGQAERISRAASRGDLATDQTAAAPKSEPVDRA